MRIMAVSLVKNEADIIESFVRHTLGFVDRLFIADHSSTDGTYEILQALCSEGLPLTIERIYELAHRQREFINRLARKAVAAGAELVLPLDADEFVVNTVDETPVREVLESLASGRIYFYDLVQCELAQPEVDGDKFILARKASRTVLDKYYHKTVVGVAAYISEPRMEIVQGNHYCEYIASKKQVPQTHMPKLALMHYACRSLEQRISKVTVGWMMNVARYGKVSLYATHWAEGFERVLAGDCLTSDRLENPQPMNYQGYPVPELKYTATGGVDYLANVLRAGVELAQSLHDRDTVAAAYKVTVVVPYLGKRDPFLATLTSCASVLYPQVEIVVLAMVELPQDIDTRSAKIVSVDVTDWRGGLATAITGDYVKLLLPGRQLEPPSITRELGYIVGETGVTLVMELGEQSYANYVEFSERMSDSASSYSPAGAEDIVKILLVKGVMPIGGMGGVLMTRELAAALGFFTGYFLDGHLLEYSLLLDAIRLNARRGDILHFIRASYCDRLTEPTAEDILWQQLEWYTQLTGNIPLATRRDAAVRYIARAQELAKDTELTAHRLYGDYNRTVQAVTTSLVTGAWK